MKKMVNALQRRRLHDEEVEVHAMVPKGGALQATDSSTMISTKL